MMHYYFYTIKNLLNNNQYIGITGDIVSRKKRHFQKLQNNQHFNPHLQYAYNKYGAENFVFEVLEESDWNSKEEAYNHEAELIKKNDSIKNGYNCNPGGLWTGPQGKFSENEVYYIKAACYFNNGVTGILGKYFDCAPATINNIRINRNYKPYCENFNLMPEEEKKQWYEDFCEHSDFETLKSNINKKQGLRKYNKEQIFIILRWCEKKFTSARNICDAFGIEYPKNPTYRHANKFREIREGKTYKDEILEYNHLTEEQKVEIERLYTEKYIE